MQRLWLYYARRNFIVCGVIPPPNVYLRSPGGKVLKGTADWFSSVYSRNEVDRDGKPTDGRTNGWTDRAVRGELRVTFDLAPARPGSVTESHVAGIKRDVP